MTKDQFKPEANYDEFYSRHSFQPLDEKTALNADMVLPRVAWALDVAREIEARNALDLCCLDGFAALTLAHKAQVSVMGVDLSSPGIKIAQSRAEKFGLPATFLQLPIEALDDRSNDPVDLVLLFEAIEHFTEVDKVMSVIKHNLKPGGTLLVSTPDAEGPYGIENVEDVCHLRVYTHKAVNDLGAATAEGKPIVSLPTYLQDHGFTIIENEVWNDLIHIRATL